MALSLFLGLQLGTAPLTLDEVRGSARENLQVLTAALDAEGAGHARTQARAAILPRLDLTAGSLAAVASPQLRVATLPKPQADGSTVYEQTTVEVRSDPQLSFSLGLQVSQLLYDGGRWWSRLAQAGAQADAARGQLDEQRLASELEAVRRFYELVRAQLTLKILRAAVARSLEQLARASALYEAGRVQRRDVLDAQVNVGNDRIAVLRQEQQVSTGRVDLLTWIARPQTDVVAVEPDAIDPSVEPRGAPDLVEAVRAARQRRPLLVALEAQRRALCSGIDVARAELWPQVTLSAGYERSGRADPFFVDPARQNSATVGVNLAWNLWAGGATDAQVQSARVSLRVLEAQVRQASLDLEGEIHRGVDTLRAQLAISQIAKENRAVAEEQLRVEVERYAAGAGLSLDVRNAQLKLTQSQLQQVTARIDVEVARALVERATGTGAAEPTRKEQP